MADMRFSRDRIDALLGMLQHYAPTGVEQEHTASWVNAMRGDGEPEEIIEKALIRALHDGLYFGNWPWLFLAKEAKNA